ncbi:type 3 dihydrofolate reductase [Candidatus Woesearchaeota archaeon]|nr:type 3 dihydrofolate reductase [Candidatus Woesearchaeota archaeon]
MIISLIVAMDENRAIGCRNKLPWNLPSELQYFREATKGKPVVMGRKTYESIGRPMPERLNIIITRDKNYTADGCIVVNSIQDAIKAAKGSHEIMVIGGSEIYRLFLPIANRLYVTKVHGKFEADTYFPEFNENEWLKSREKFVEKDNENKYSYTTLVLERKKG